MSNHYPALKGAVFEVESPFRRLPVNLDMTQRLFLDGIRFAVEMAQLSHVRLRDLLSLASIDHDKNYSAAEAATSGFLDAWNIVDSIHRMRELLSAMPRLKKRGPLLGIFMRGTAETETLRNRIQHLRGELSNRALSHLPAWGTLSWLWVLDTSMTLFLSGYLTAGADAPHSRLILFPNNREFHDQLDHITLSVGDAKLDISEAMRLVIRVVRGLELSLREQFKDDQNVCVSDYMMLFTIDTSTTESAPQNTCSQPAPN